MRYRPRADLDVVVECWKNILGEKFGVVRLDFISTCSANSIQMSNKTRELCNISLKLPIEFLTNRIKFMVSQFKLKYIYFSGMDFFHLNVAFRADVD